MSQFNGSYRFLDEMHDRFSHVVIFEITRANKHVFNKLGQLDSSRRVYEALFSGYVAAVNHRFNQSRMPLKIKTAFVSCNGAGCTIPPPDTEQHQGLIDQTNLMYCTKPVRNIARVLKSNIKANRTTNDLSRKLHHIPRAKLFDEVGANGCLAEEYVIEAIRYGFEHFLPEDVEYRLFARVPYVERTITYFFNGNKACSMLANTGGGESDVLLFMQSLNNVKSLLEALVDHAIGFRDIHPNHKQ